MKIAWKIVRRVLLTLGLTVYILVALVNFSVVQSYLGALAGSYFSKEWGGKVYIGSLHAMPFDHVIADNLLWVSPTGDTLLVADQLKVSFERFPYSDRTLEFDRVYLKDAYYHFAIEDHKTNLQFLIDYFKSEKKKEKHGPFTVKVKTLDLDNVHYRMDLSDHGKKMYAHGVQIPHMEFFDIHAKIKDILVINDDVTCKIVKFSTREKSGFQLDEFSGQIHVSREEIVAKNMTVETPHSRIAMDASLSYDGWHGFKGYVHTVQHEAEIKPGSRVAMSDVAYWAPSLWGVDATVEAQGVVSGTIDSLVTDLEVSWGQHSSAQVSGSIMGLPKIDTTVFDLEVEHLTTQQEDLAPLMRRVNLPESTRNIVDKIGFVDLIASLRGGINDYATVNILADCGLGRLRADAVLRKATTGYDVSVDAESSKIDLSFLNSQWIKHMGFALSADGTWNGSFKDLSNWRQKLALAVDGHVTHCAMKGYTLSAAHVTGELRAGHLTTSLVSSDTLADLRADIIADIGDKEQSVSADIDISNMNLGILPYPLATKLEVSASGESFEDIDGHLVATDTRYGNMTLNNVDLSVKSDATRKEIALKSDLADATMKGNFIYTDLPLILKYFCQLYLPDLFNEADEMDKDMVERLRNDVFSYRVKWNDDGRLLGQMIKKVSIAPGTIIDGSYNFGEQLKLVMVSDSLRIGTVKLKNVGISGRPAGDNYEIQADIQTLNIGKIELFERVNAKLNSQKNLSSVELKWGSHDTPTRGDLSLELAKNNVSITSDFLIGETPWKLSTEGITLDRTEEGRLRVNSEKMQLESRDQKIDARMQINGDNRDCVELNFDHFDTKILSDMLLQKSPITVAGDISGHFSLYGLVSTPYFNSNLTIDSCQVNSQHLGMVKLSSSWNSAQDNLTLKLTSKQFHVTGNLEMGKKENNLDFNVDFNSLELAMVQPLLSNFSSHVGGTLHGNMKISGDISHPRFIGKAMVDNGEIKIDITDVTYHFADSLWFEDNTITLKDFDIFDPLENKATANGTIHLTNEWKAKLDVGLTTDNFLVLNKKSGEQFYGKLLASVDGRATGFIDNLNIKIRTQTNPGCDITVPISTQQHVKSQNYITFVGDKIDEEGVTTAKKKRKTDFTLDLDLDITPDAKINLPMNFSEVAVNVGGTGSGELHLNLSNANGAQMTGIYEISSGTMKVGLLTVYEKRFIIEQGSKLVFPGNVPDARFDVKAVHSQRANLSTLTGSLSSVDNNQKYIQVESIIAISGTLKDPNLSFDLRLPNADQSVEAEVFAYIDRNSERDMMNQTLSLLIYGNFYNVNSESQTGSSPLDIVTSFVGNSLTDMVQFVDVNIDYKSATELTNQQLDVNISKDWGRWYLESTLGYGGESRELKSSTANGTIIDALIGYRLSSVLHLYAYNRTNTNDYTRIDLPFKQGAGLKLTKDFDSWSDLFKRKKKKK